MTSTAAVLRSLALIFACLAGPALATPKISLTGAPPARERPTVTVALPADFRDAAEQWRSPFEAECGCALRVKTFDDPQALLAAEAGEADVVVGLPLSLLEAARRTGRFAPHGRPAPISLPVTWSDDTFAPVGYGWLAFVYDTSRLTAAPTSFPEIAKAGPNALRIAMDDPRVSSVGFEAVAWMRATHKEAAGVMWAGMAPKLVLAQTRAEALARLEAGEVDLALATTSWPATRAEHGAPRHRATPFREGQLLQIDTAAMRKDAAHPQIAAQFLAFLVTPEAQAVVAARRGMYPVHPAAALPESFGRLTMPSWSIALDAKEMDARRDAWFAEWARATGR